MRNRRRIQQGVFSEKSNCENRTGRTCPGRQHAGKQKKKYRPGGKRTHREHSGKRIGKTRD